MDRRLVRGKCRIRRFTARGLESRAARRRLAFAAVDEQNDVTRLGLGDGSRPKRGLSLRPRRLRPLTVASDVTNSRGDKRAYFVHSNHLILSALQTVGPKAGSAAAAQAQDTTQPAAPGGAGAQAHDTPAPSFGMAFLLPLLILVPFFFFSSRRQKKEQAERAKMKRGDRVLSTSGLVGELMEIDERFAKVKLAPGITVQMLASTLGLLDVPDAASSSKSDDLKDLKDAKVISEKSAPAK